MKAQIEIVNKEASGKVYSYARWSSDKQNDGDSQRRQLHLAETWCQRKGLKLAEKRFVDSGVSAYRGRNQKGDLGKLVETLQAGDTLLVEDADRLSRQDWKTAMDFLQTILCKGVKVVTLQNGNEITEEGFRTNPGVFLPVILNSHLGNAENVKKAKRVRESWETKRAEIQEGSAIRQRLPGWLRHEKIVDANGRVSLGKVIVNESRAATVRRIFKLALQGQSARQIAETLNREGVPCVSSQAFAPSPKGTAPEHKKPVRWNGESLKATILKNPAVMGDYKVVENKKPTGEIIRGIFPAAVSETDFYVVKKLLGGPRLTVPAKAVSECLVTGLCGCAVCGGNLAHMTSHAHGRTYKYLVCSANKAGQAIDARCKSRVRYEAFESSLLAVLSRADKIRAALSGGSEAADTALALDTLRAQVSDCDRRAGKIWKMIDDDNNPPKRLKDELKRAETEGERLRAVLQGKELEAKSAPAPIASYRDFREQMAGKMSEPEFRQRAKALIRQFVSRIEIGADLASYTINFVGGNKIQATFGPGGTWFIGASGVNEAVVSAT